MHPQVIVSAPLQWARRDVSCQYTSDHPLGLMLSASLSSIAVAPRDRERLPRIASILRAHPVVWNTTVQQFALCRARPSPQTGQPAMATFPVAMSSSRVASHLTVGPEPSTKISHCSTIAVRSSVVQEWPLQRYKPAAAGLHRRGVLLAHILPLDQTQWFRLSSLSARWPSLALPSSQTVSNNTASLTTLQSH